MTASTQLAPPSTYTADTTTSPPSPTDQVERPPRWNAATLVAFRFCFTYFGLYVLTTQMLPGMLPFPLPPVLFRTLVPPVAGILWIGRHVLGISRVIGSNSTGSGDKTFDWVQSFSLLLVAALVTAVWSALARNKENHARLYKWFRLFLRFALGTTMLGYGMTKVFPMQMPILALKRLVEPFGNFSPMGVLWYSVGASPAYEIFVGTAETAAAVLLFLPRTALLGALVCLMDTIGVFTMNMTYDVPVKLFSFHLVLMSLFLIAPNASRLFQLFLQRRATSLLGEPELGGSARARGVSTALQVAFGLYMIGFMVYQDAAGWKQFGGGAPTSALFGIWEVQHATVDGQPRPALFTDSTTWRRVIFQRPTMASFQRSTDTFSDYGAAIDTNAKTLTLTATDSAKTKSTLSYRRPDKDRLILDGTMDGHSVHMELAFRNPDSYLQRSRGFHWISETPFNR